MKELLLRVRAYAGQDVDDGDRATILDLAGAAESGDSKALADLQDRFSGPLSFGTAGLRGILGAGETRMNRSVVTRTTYGLVKHMIDAVPDAKTRGLVIGRDGRHGSAEFQRDAAEVCAALGVKVHWLPGTSPTPLVAFGVLHLKAAAGVMVTASHNPPAYNGYKVYWHNGAQINTPTDGHIADAIQVAPPANVVPRQPLDAARTAGLVVDATFEPDYLEALAGHSRLPDAPVGDLVVAYSAMHGVGEAILRKAFAARGLSQLHTVAEQAEPDGDFPTVSFPNPEEPGALDLVQALAVKTGADIVLVNDPDADRLGVAVPDADGQFSALSGNEIGVLLADHVMREGGHAPDSGLFVTTLVSSQLLAKMASDRGFRYAETLTGFKWIANEGLRLEAQEGLQFAFGYEEALGYTVGQVVRDKDGIGAALVMAELAAALKAEGQTLRTRLEQIRRDHGFFVGRAKSVTLPGREGRAQIEAAMRHLRACAIGDVPEAESLWDLSTQTRTYSDGRTEPVARGSGDVLVFELKGGGRACVRPSGTEPKVKLYLEVVQSLAEGEGAEAPMARGEAQLDRLQAELLKLARLT